MREVQQSLLDEANCWQLLVAHLADHVLLFQLDQGVAIVCLFDLFGLSDLTRTCLRVQVVEQIVILDTRLGDSLTEVRLK